ncbi:MAG: PLP-dependent aminotransferase family protein, partial [Umezawaea sp.]
MARLLGDWRRRGARQGTADLAAGIRMLVVEGQLPGGARQPAAPELADAQPGRRPRVHAAP